jgi:hypothetical protein
MTMLLEPNRDQLEIFADALFRHADKRGFVSMRAFYEDDAAKPFRINPTALSGGLKFLIDVAEDDARRAANDPRPVVFCPPIATFVGKDRAREIDILEGLALSAECDHHPQGARETLERILGAATVVVRSGGWWTDPATGQQHDKLHLHWRLAAPATGEALARLKEARDLATRVVGGDPSNKPVCHPIRWPGSWHRKSAPRLCEIADLQPDHELALDTALQFLTVLAKNLGKDQANKTGVSDEPRGEWAELIQSIITGESLHTPIAALAMKLLVAGMTDGAAVNILRGLMDASTAPRDLRWRTRYGEIPRAVSTARAKLGEEANEQPSPTPTTLHWWHDRNATAVERSWLVENLLLQETTALASGVWGSYKSFAALDLAAAVMAGSTFISFPVRRRGGVLFLAVEGASEIPIRLARGTRRQISAA